VTDMDAEARRAEFEAGLARSHVMLDPEACRAAVAEENAAQRVHRDDGFSCDWAAGMPRKAEPTPTPQPHQPSVAEIEMQRSQDWTRFVDSRIERAIAARDEFWRDVLAGLVSEVRKQLRAEIVEQVGSLRADIEIAKAHAGDRDAEVIDLPMLARSRHA
jgi:hypothetical protein